MPYGIRAKYDRISKQAKDRYSIQISESGVRRLINKWHNTETLADRPRENKSKCLISKAGILAINNALLNNSFLTVKKIKVQLVLTASTRTFSIYINMLGWRKVNTKYCQMVNPVNRVKRFIFCCMLRVKMGSAEILFHL